MLKRKQVRERGKLKLSIYFQKLEQGDRVAIVRELSQKASFPSRLQGKVGVIESKRGSNYIIKLKDYKQEKRFIIHPIHLKKLK